MLGFMPGTKRQGGQKRQWIDNVTQWTGKGLVDIVRLAEERESCIDDSYLAPPTLVYRARHYSILHCTICYHFLGPPCTSPVMRGCRSECRLVSDIVSATTQ